MERVRQLLLLLLIALSCAMIAAALVGIVELVKWERSTQKRTDAILTHVDVIVGRSQRVMEKVEEAAMRQKEVSDASLQILANTSAVILSTKETVHRANVLLATTTEQMRGIGADADEIQIAAVRTLEDVKQAVRPVPELLADTDKTVNSLNGVIAGPDVKATLHEVSESAANVNGMTANLNEASRDLEHFTARATKPANALKAFTLRLLGPVATFFGTHF